MKLNELFEAKGNGQTARSAQFRKDLATTTRKHLSGASDVQTSFSAKDGNASVRIHSRAPGKIKGDITALKKALLEMIQDFQDPQVSFNDFSNDRYDHYFFVLTWKVGLNDTAKKASKQWDEPEDVAPTKKLH